MKAFGLLIGAGLMALAAGQANATVSIYLQDGANGAIVSGGTGMIGASFGNATTGFGSFSTVQVTGIGDGVTAGFQTNNLNVATKTGGQLIVYLVNDGLTQLPGSLLSTFTSNSQAGLQSLTTSTYITSAMVTAANVATVGTLMGTASFDASSAVSTKTSLYDTKAQKTPYAEIVRYDVKLGANGTANSTINISAGAVPEPASWAMMLMGFGFMGYALRQRRGAKVSFG